MTNADRGEFQALFAEELASGFGHAVTLANLGQTEAQQSGMLAVLRSRKATRTTSAKTAALAEEAKWAPYK